MQSSKRQIIHFHSRLSWWYTYEHAYDLKISWSFQASYYEKRDSFTKYELCGSVMHTSFFIIKLKGKFYESVKFHISNSQSKELKHKFQINICIFISAHRKDTLHKASEHGKKVLIECSFVKWESEEKKVVQF